MTSRIGIVGATGYTGQELARLLRTHPGLELTASFSTRAGQASVQGEVAARRAGVDLSEHADVRALRVWRPPRRCSGATAGGLTSPWRRREVSV